MIGILTLYHNNTNYGGLLQSYALQKVISKRYGECEQISYECTKSSVSEKLKNNLFCISFYDILIVLFQKIASCFREKDSKKTAVYLERRKELIQAFENEIRHSKVVNKESIQSLSGRYSHLIAGSGRTDESFAEAGIFFLFK